MKSSNSIIVQYKITSNIPTSTITKHYARTTYAGVEYSYIATLYTAVQIVTIFRDKLDLHRKSLFNTAPVLDVPYLPHIFQLPINHKQSTAKLWYNVFYMMTYLWLNNYYTSINCEQNRYTRLTLSDSFKKCGISNVLTCTF